MCWWLVRGVPEAQTPGLSSRGSLFGRSGRAMGRARLIFEQEQRMKYVVTSACRAGGTSGQTVLLLPAQRRGRELDLRLQLVKFASARVNS